MSNVTVTFDPNNMFTTTTFARERGISTSGALAWLNRHAASLPDPAFVLRTVRVDNRPMFQRFWHAKDGKRILDIAKKMDEERGAADIERKAAAKQRRRRVLPTRQAAQLDSVLD